MRLHLNYIISNRMTSRERENRRSKTARDKSYLELPKLQLPSNKAAKPVIQQTTYLQRYQWITRNTGYLLLSTPAIQQEQQYITNELNALNNQYMELLRSLNSSSNAKPLKKSRQINLNDRSSEIRDREIENNYALIYKLRGESELLYRRMSAVGNGKSEHDCNIIDLKEKILKTKQKIKELKLKSREMGDSIENGQSGFIEQKRLSQQYEANETKRMKLEEKYAVSKVNMQNLQEKLDQINQQWMFAQQWLAENAANTKVVEEQKGMEQQYFQRNYQLQITKKTLETMKNTKQQKYLQLLREFQQMSEKTNSLDQKFQELQIKNLYQKKEIIQLEASIVK